MNIEQPVMEDILKSESAGGQGAGVHAQTGTMCNNVKTQSDIRKYFEDTKPGPSFVKPKQANISMEEEKFDKMRMIRNKMVETRRIEDRNLAEKFKTTETPIAWRLH